MGLRIQVILSDDALAYIDARRGQMGRGSYVRRMCDAVAATAALRPPVAEPADVADEIAEMFDEYSGHERPAYGSAPVRHPNRDRGYE